jgi:hypothetical protein
MFYDDVTCILNNIIGHTLDNDIKFQCKKLLKKISLKKFLTLDENSQKKEIFNLMSDVRYGYDTVKSKKIIATDIIENIIRSKINIG